MWTKVLILILMAIAATVIVVLTYEDPAPSIADKGQNWHQEGREEAERDIEAGKLCMRFSGLHRDPSFEYADRVQKKLGVMIRFTGCETTSKAAAREAGYNEVMEKEIERRFGPNALSDIWDEVDEEYKKKVKDREATK